jgi:ABC-type branched-subunit amino acid transport system permease subunit
LLTVPVGAIVAIPAIRLSGLYLAVATFGFGILIEYLFFPTGLMFGIAGAINTPRPAIWGLDGDKGFYFTVLVIVALIAALAVYVMRSRLGRLLRAMSDSPTALSAMGTNVNVTCVLIFCISAFMAGIAGALFGAVIQSINGQAFGYFNSLQWLAVLAISGVPFRYAPLPTALLGGASIAVLPVYINNTTFNNYLPAIFGVAAVLNALMTDRDSGRGSSRSEQWTTRAMGRQRSPVAERSRPEPVTQPAPVG